MSEWTTERAIQVLREKGKPGAAEIYRKHGVREVTVGLSSADQGVIVKNISRDHALAVDLWQSGIHDARILATKIADPDALTRKQMESWLAAASNYVIVDALAFLAARSPDAMEWAMDWTKKDGEWVSSAGWTTIAVLAQEGRLEPAKARFLVARVVRELHGAPNRTRHAMNLALISIGGNLVGLRDDALAAAKKIGRVVVDHGQTGCKTPDAAAYIAKMVAHRAKKAAPEGKAEKSVKI